MCTLIQLNIRNLQGFKNLGGLTNYKSMIKRTLFFANPVYLSTKREQLLVTYPQNEPEPKSVPIEDIGVVVLENQQITITNGLLQQLTNNNVALINCNHQHLPIGLLMPLNGHTTQSERFRNQINASAPLKKNLWQQTIIAKINNQATLLKDRDIATNNMDYWARQVTSGDMLNHEARAAAYFWKHLFEVDNFNRSREGQAPNNLLNYGYAILRAITARALVSSGLLPTLGIHHRNKYNAYCLADDIMEPYRPFVDKLVCEIIDDYVVIDELTIEMKKQLLSIPVLDVSLNGNKSPLMIAMSRTTNSLQECFMGESRKISYPAFI